MKFKKRKGVPPKVAPKSQPVAGGSPKEGKSVTLLPFHRTKNRVIKEPYILSEEEQEKGEREFTLKDAELGNEKLAELEAIRRKRAEDQARQSDGLEVNHYCVLVFDCYTQMKEFSEKMLERGVDSTHGMYYDGIKFAEQFGVTLTPTLKLRPLKVLSKPPYAGRVKVAEIEAAHRRKQAKRRPVPKGKPK